MKTFSLVFALTLLFSITAVSQKKLQVGDMLKLPEESNLYSEPSIMSKEIKLPQNETVIILKLEDDHGYYYVKCKDLTGYLSSIKIIASLRSMNSDPDYLKMMAKIKDYQSKQVDETEDYIKYYGQPNSNSEYASGDYRSKTLVWHCAKGKYRSVDFRYSRGSWIKESEYTSDCI
jgi:hypothetical protein